MKKKTAMLCLFGGILISNAYCMNVDSAKNNSEPATTPVEIPSIVNDTKAIDLEGTPTPVEIPSTVDDTKATDYDYIEIDTIQPIGLIDPSTIIDKKNIPFDYKTERGLFLIFKSLAVKVDKTLDRPNASMAIICALKEALPLKGISNCKQYYNKLFEQAKMDHALKEDFINGLAYEIKRLKFSIEFDSNNNKTIKPVSFIESNKLDKYKFNINRSSYRLKKAINCIMQIIPSSLDIIKELEGNVK